MAVHYCSSLVGRDLAQLMCYHDEFAWCCHQNVLHMNMQKRLSWEFSLSDLNPKTLKMFNLQDINMHAGRDLQWLCFLSRKLSSVFKGWKAEIEVSFILCAAEMQSTSFEAPQLTEVYLYSYFLYNAGLRRHCLPPALWRLRGWKPSPPLSASIPPPVSEAEEKVRY